MKPEAPSPKILFCIEDPLYRGYLEPQVVSGDDAFVAYEQFPFRVAEDPQGILVLQSDNREFDLLEMCKRLKRLFSDAIKIVLLSSDYKTYEYAHTIVDSFLHFPVSFPTLMETTGQLTEKKRKKQSQPNSQIKKTKNVYYKNT